MPSQTAIVPATPVSEFQDLIDSRWAPSTQRNYRTGWQRFQDWCQENGVESLPADPLNVCRFLKSQAAQFDHLSRITTAYNAIRWVHVRQGLPSPTQDDRVRLIMGGVRRKLGRRNEGKTPLFGDALVRTVRGIDRSTLAGKRDAALILVGFWLALRRSSLIFLKADPSDLRPAPHGYSIFLSKSKTDQERIGTWFFLERRPTSILCPVKALADWLTASKIKHGSIFVKVMVNGGLWTDGLEGHAVAEVIKKRASAAGLDPQVFSGHSMRSGFVTESMEAGVQTASIRDVTGHTSDAMLLRYWRHYGSPSKQSPGKIIRLEGETDGR
ncbi:MAG: site-specific integrase [Terriglobales bacterium]